MLKSIKMKIAQQNYFQYADSVDMNVNSSPINCSGLVALIMFINTL